MKIRDELHENRARWDTLSVFEKFEQVIVFIISLLIVVVVAVATWQLILHTLALVLADLRIPVNFEIFQAFFGMIFTVLIALEFKRTLVLIEHNRTDVVQVNSVILIALLALVRKFIILDVHTTTPAFVAALSGAVLALGLVYWLLRRQKRSRVQP